MGVDLCFNKFVGTQMYYSESYDDVRIESFNDSKTVACFHMNVGFGF